jgi:hypothetical protein
MSTQQRISYFASRASHELALTVFVARVVGASVAADVRKAGARVLAESRAFRAELDRVRAYCGQ